MRTWFLLLCLFSAAAEAETVYRCRDASGVMSFSDSPCGPNAERIEIRPTPGVVTRPVAEPDQDAYPEDSGYPPLSDPRPRDNCPSTLAINQAIARKQVMLCMTPQQVDRASDPSLRESFRTSSGTDEFGSYLERYYARSDSGWPRYIKFRNNKVIEFRDDAPPPACYPNCGAYGNDGYPVYPYPVYPVPPRPRPPRPEPRDGLNVDVRVDLGDYRPPPPSEPAPAPASHPIRPQTGGNTRSTPIEPRP